MAKYVPKAQPVDAFQVQEIIGVTVSLDDGGIDTVPSASTGDYVVHSQDGTKTVMDADAFNSAYQAVQVVPQ